MLSIYLARIACLCKYILYVFTIIKLKLCRRLGNLSVAIEQLSLLEFVTIIPATMTRDLYMDNITVHVVDHYVMSIFYYL